MASSPLHRDPDGKVHFLRVNARFAPDGTVRVDSAGGQQSHQLRPMAAANALAVLPDGAGVDAGDAVTALLLDLPAPADAGELAAVLT